MSRAGEEISLTATEFELLRFLMRNPRRVLSKAQILDRVWNYDFGGQANVVELYISYLRKKIDAGREPMIHTMRGAGYVLKPTSMTGCALPHPHLAPGHHDRRAGRASPRVLIGTVTTLPCAATSTSASTTGRQSLDRSASPTAAAAPGPDRTRHRAAHRARASTPTRATDQALRDQLRRRQPGRAAGHLDHGHRAARQGARRRRGARRRPHRAR